MSERRRRDMKDLPAEFFLPPPTSAGLWRQTVALCLVCLVYIMILAGAVALGQGIVVRL